MKKYIFVFTLLITLLILSSEGRAYLPPSSLMIPRAGIAQPVFFKELLQRFFGANNGQAPQATESYYIHDEQTFGENTKAFHMRPYNNASLEFDIFLPKNWTVEDLTQGQEAHSLGEDLIVDVARFKSEVVGTSRVSVIISTQPMSYDIGAKDWLKNYILKNGYALLGDINGATPYLASAYYTSVIEGLNFQTYVSVSINAGFAIITRFEAPLALKDYLAFIQKRSVDSFQPSYPKKDLLEIQKTFTLVDALKFSYPVSWQVGNPDFKNLARLSVELQRLLLPAPGTRAKPVVDGYIRIIAIRRLGDTNLIKEIEDQRKTFPELFGMEATKMVSSDKAKAKDRFIFSRYEVYETAYKNAGRNNPEVRLAVLGDNAWYIFVYLITPSEQTNLLSWARNVHTFNTLIETAK